MGHNKTPKILVVGANSFIGSHLISLLKPHFSVTGIYHKNKSNLYPDIENVSMTEIDSLEDGFDFVYLMSAYIPAGTGLTDAERKTMFEVNIEVTKKICTAFPNSKIIYCSSVSVYSNSPNAITEADVAGGSGEYGISKLWGEYTVRQMPRFAIVRCSSVYGKRMNSATIIPAFVKQGLTGNITIRGNGNRQQNYIHVSDVVEILIRSAKFQGNDIFLATGRESISNIALAQLVKSETGCRIVFEGEDLSPSFFYNNKQTVRKLEYVPQVRIKDGIKEIIQWTKEAY